MIRASLGVFLQFLHTLFIQLSAHYKARQFKMNKSGCLQIALGKPSSKELTKIKEKLRTQEHKSKQYESMCEVEEAKHLHSIIPFPRERKISKKDIKQNSPGCLIRSKSKTFDQSIKKLSEEKLPKGHLNELYTELMTIKAQYKALKQSYNKIVIEKNELTSREQSEKEAIQSELEQRAMEVQKYQKVAMAYEQQIERIKKQCYKFAENQKLKNKKLEETIQQKDLMIAYLRNELDRIKRGGQSTLASINQSSLVYLQGNPPFGHSGQSNVIVEEISHPRREGKFEEDSLSFSRDKSKEMDSIHSFLTAQDHSINLPTRKDLVIVETHSSYAQNDSEQCLTFEHRGEEEGDHMQGLKNEGKPLKGSLLSSKGKSAHNLPPKNGSKVRYADFRKKGTQADENNPIDSNKHELTDIKKCMNSSLSSRQRKKNSSKKKKP